LFHLVWLFVDVNSIRFNKHNVYEKLYGVS